MLVMSIEYLDCVKVGLNEKEKRNAEKRKVNNTFPSCTLLLCWAFQ